MKVYQQIGIWIIAVAAPSLVVGQSIDRSASGSVRTPAEREAMRQVYQQQHQNWRFENLRRLSQQFRQADFDDPKVTITVFPKELQERAKRYLVPSAYVRSRHADFLKVPGSGIVKLSQEQACISEPSDIRKGIDKLIEKCPFNFVPGHAGNFSFRQKQFVGSVISDVGIMGGWIYSYGLLNQGILINLGDINLATVNLDADGIKGLVTFVPSTELGEADKQRKQWEDGVEIDNLVYRQILPIELNSTYALRVVAYNNANWSYESDTPYGRQVIRPLSGDTRDDIIVVFRIVEKDDHGSITLLWKELKREKAPELIVPKS